MKSSICVLHCNQRSNEDPNRIQITDHPMKYPPQLSFPHFTGQADHRSHRLQITDHKAFNNSICEHPLDQRVASATSVPIEHLPDLHVT